MKTLAARLILAAAISLPFTSGSMAQTYPSRPITVVIPFAGGSASDVVSRIMLQRMSKSMGQPIVVENRPGAGGNTGPPPWRAPHRRLRWWAPARPVAAMCRSTRLGTTRKKTSLISPFAGFTIVVVASTAAGQFAEGWCPRKGRATQLRLGHRRLAAPCQRVFAQVTNTQLSHVPIATSAIWT
jgi:hypothetical protein